MKSADVVERMLGYAHRRAIQDAIGDLDALLTERQLRLDDYLHANKQTGHYALNNVRVDIVEVLRRRDDPTAVDSLLSDLRHGRGEHQVVGERAAAVEPCGACGGR